MWVLLRALIAEFFVFHSMNTSRMIMSLQKLKWTCVTVEHRPQLVGPSTWPCWLWCAAICPSFLLHYSHYISWHIIMGGRFVTQWLMGGAAKAVLITSSLVSASQFYMHLRHGGFGGRRVDEHSWPGSHACVPSVLIALELYYKSYSLFTAHILTYTNTCTQEATLIRRLVIGMAAPVHMTDILEGHKFKGYFPIK